MNFSTTVLIVVQEGATRYIAKAIPTLKKIGAYNIKTGKRWRKATYCLVGKIGRKGRKGLVKQVQKEPGKGDSEIKKYFVKPYSRKS